MWRLWRVIAIGRVVVDRRRSVADGRREGGELTTESRPFYTRFESWH
jgi:hypothetical protein